MLRPPAAWIIWCFGVVANVERPRMTELDPSQARFAAEASSQPQTLTPELHAWLTTQRQQGRGDAELIEAMMRSGWHQAVAQAAVRGDSGGGSAADGFTRTAWMEGHTPRQGLASVPDPLRGTGESRLKLADADVRVLMALDQPRIVVLGDLLSAQECRQLRDLAQPRLTRSQTVDTQTGGSEVNTARTSQGMFFERGETSLISAIEARIAELVDWPVDQGEGLQILRYGPGAEYRPHYDYFDPDQPGSARVLSRGGQRVATLVMYLNEVEAGGATTFPDAGVQVQPQMGGAVFFSYSQATPASRTLHAGAPVTQGENWVATKWFRESVFD